MQAGSAAAHRALLMQGSMPESNTGDGSPQGGAWPEVVERCKAMNQASLASQGDGYLAMNAHQPSNLPSQGAQGSPMTGKIIATASVTNYDSPSSSRMHGGSTPPTISKTKPPMKALQFTQVRHSGAYKN